MASLVMRPAALLAALATSVLLYGGAPAAAAENLEKLGPQALVKGQCGLFLWARSEDQSFVVVAYDNPSSVRVRIDGRDLQMPRKSFSGEPLHGHFESQVFSDGAFNVGIDIEFDNERPIRDGGLIRRGLVRYGRNGEPETIMPVGGIAACKRS